MTYQVVIWLGLSGLSEILGTLTCNGQSYDRMHSSYAA